MVKKKSGEKESVLEYAAKGVFNKALKAEENLKSSSRNTVKGEEWGQKDSEKWKKKSQEVWYDRFVRTDFKEVDLSETFRTVFVNCTFDENCVLPTEKSSIDPKYFSNCRFSKILMNKVENKELKKALEEAGMIFDEDSGLYKMDNKKENPNPSFKPIESFQLIENYAERIQ